MGLWFSQKTSFILSSISLLSFSIRTKLRWHKPRRCQKYEVQRCSRDLRNTEYNFTHHNSTPMRNAQSSQEVKIDVWLFLSHPAILNLDLNYAAASGRTKSVFYKKHVSMPSPSYYSKTTPGKPYYIKGALVREKTFKPNDYTINLSISE